MRLIDADALKEKMLDVGETGEFWVVDVDDIEALPTIDAVPVVRCRECKNMYEDCGGTTCIYGAFVDCITPNDFYCAFGERSEE